MSLEFVNRICPNCKNPNYMILLGDFCKAYKYKCMNCNWYFNDIDFEKEPLKPVWESKCMNTKVDMVEVVRCKDCKNGSIDQSGINGVWCPAHAEWHDNNWFCSDGVKRDE